MKKSETTTEQNLLIRTLAAYVNEEPVFRVPDNVDVGRLVALADAQQVSSIMYYQTKLPELQSSFAVASYHSVNRENLLKQIDEKFNATEDAAGERCEAVRYLIFKGSEVGQYYPHKYLRTSGDIDMLVHAEDKVRAGEMLESMGFSSSEHKSSDHEWVYMKGGFKIELHHRLLYDGDNLNDKRITAFTDRAWGYVFSGNQRELSECCETGAVVRYHLEQEFHFVFVLLHLRKHFLWAGVGIRQFMDLAVMMRNAELDYAKVDDYIGECGIDKFAGVCFSLIERMFGVSSPMKTTDISDEFYYRAVSTILSEGVFGDMSHENISANEVMNTAGKHGRIRSAARVVFPAYEQIKVKYPDMCSNDVVGRVLLPAMWVRRIAESVVKKSAGSGLSYAAKHLEENSERIEMLSEWGIV